MITMTTETNLLENSKMQLKIDITASTVLPKELFLYRTTVEGTYIFSTVCTLYDVNTYPANTPEPGKVFFRYDIATLEFDTMSELIKFIDDTKYTLEILEKEYIRASNLGEVVTHVINEDI